MAKEIVAEFKELWNSPYALSFDTFYENYKERYQIIKHQREAAKLDEITSIEKYTLQPNSMQVGFITNLKKFLQRGKNGRFLFQLPEQEKHMPLHLQCVSLAFGEFSF